MSALLAALSAVLWGSADFGGGLLSRRLPSGAVVSWSQGFALLVFAPLAAVLALHEGTWPLPTLGWGLAAGLAGACGLLAFYRALAIGTMGVVSPIAGLGAVVPLAAGLLAGERLSGPQSVGVLAALCGAVLASGPELVSARGERGRGEGHSRTARLSVALAVVAGTLFGLTFVLISYGARASSDAGVGGVFRTVLTIAAMRIASTGMLALGAVLRRAVVIPAKADLIPLALVGIADAGANVLFGYATTLGLTSVVSVLGSLYPVITVLAARVFLGERLQPLQSVGVLVALCGVALLSAG